VNWPEGVGCREKDNLRLAQLGPKWQSCTTFGTSFGYLAAEEADDYPYTKKNAGEVIHEMIEVVSRNGNFLINIGPRADGTIPEWQVERLRAMGDWLKINGAAIYGSRYWHTTGQASAHLAFTTNGKKLYAICLQQPKPFTIEATKGWTAADVESIRLLGSNGKVEWGIGENGLRITPPADLGASKHAWVFEILTTKNQHTPAELGNALQEKRQTAIHSPDSTDYDSEKKKPKAPEIDRQ
jgi:alpha-L-fucosidase